MSLKFLLRILLHTVRNNMNLTYTEEVQGQIQQHMFVKKN